MAEITVTARVSFLAVDKVACRLRGVDFPIELALLINMTGGKLRRSSLMK